MATKLCLCGFFGDPTRQCTCSPQQVRLYQSRVSGPLMDRIDIQIEVPAVPFKDLAAEHAGPSSDQVRREVLSARQIQLQRFKGGKVFANAQMSTRQLRQHCALDAANLALLERAMQKFKLSARAYGRILKIARTIADMEGAREIGLTHLSEAIGYRSLDRGLA